MLPDFRVRQRDYLLEISRALTQDLELNSLLARILDISLEMLVGQAGLIALRSDVGGWLVEVSHGLSPTFLRLIKPYLAKIPDYEDPRSTELPEVNRWLRDITETTSMGLLTGVGLPLLTRQKLVGMIFIFRSSPGIFSTNDVSLLRSFADQAAIAIQNAQLYQQINREKQRLDALLDTAADGILILKPDLKIERCNPAFLKIISLTREEVVGNIHEQIIRWEVQPRDGSLERAVADGWPLTPNAILYVEGDLKRNGDLPSLPVSITYAPLIAPDGTLVNIIAQMRDITRFRQADEIKSTFVSIVSHELKTPVALIKGYVSTLRRDDAKWDPQIVKESLTVIEEEADHLSSLIENLLEATRVQSDGLSIKRSDCSLPDMIKRVARKFQVQTKTHTIIVDMPPDFPIILCDERRLEQVLSNLISNSIKYSAKGEIRIHGQIRSDVIIICVTDEGPGITPEDLPHVFDRFYRGSETAKRYKGAGLGLYLAKAIIESHGGRIWVDQDRKGGAHICFSLPR
jgi:PAS domain S-box-containing protein